MESAAARKRRGAWYTPPELADALAAEAVAALSAAVTEGSSDRPAGDVVTVVDPACGDGRLLAAVAAALAAGGWRAELVGVDVDAEAAEAAAASVPDARVVCADALTLDWSTLRPAGGFQIVIGNPPFLSQLAATTARGGASERGGGPYADAAVEFLALATELVDRDAGAIALILPQSVLASRDAAEVRAGVDAIGRLAWAHWSTAPQFDASVLTCALAFSCRTDHATAGGGSIPWTAVITERLGVPPLPAALSAESSHVVTLGDVAWLNANFRDEYYGMIPAVGDHPTGPPLVSSGLIDPGVCRWGQQPVRFAKQRFRAPRLDLDLLEPWMQRWAHRRLVPKVLVANQTRVIEAVCDEVGAWLPAVPVTSIYPHGDNEAERGGRAWEIAALLTSASVSAWAWHRCAGTGLSARTVRIGPGVLGALPLPAGDLAPAVEALRNGDLAGCSRAVAAAYTHAGDGAAPEVDDELEQWWWAQLPVRARPA